MSESVAGSPSPNSPPAPSSGSPIGATDSVPGSPPAVPDHELLLKIGGGSYGEVWLARNQVGTLRAVKIVCGHVFEARSFVWTEAFIPPEEPGTPQADLYSLGKLLYEAATGLDRREFPRLPALPDEGEAVFLRTSRFNVRHPVGGAASGHQSDPDRRSGLKAAPRLAPATWGCTADGSLQRERIRPIFACVSRRTAIDPVP